jgi:hypothetical protein
MRAVYADYSPLGANFMSGQNNVNPTSAAKINYYVTEF